MTATPLALVRADFPLNETLTPCTGSPTSVTLNVTLAAREWLNDVGLAVSFSAGSTCVWNSPVVVSWTLLMRSTGPFVPSMKTSLRLARWLTGLSERTLLNAVALWLVHTRLNLFDWELNHATSSRPPGP